MWRQTKNGKNSDRNFQWWNEKDGKPTLIVEVWRASPNDWRASVNNSWLTQNSSKGRAMYYAKEYMRRIQ